MSQLMQIQRLIVLGRPQVNCVSFKAMFIVEIVFDEGIDVLVSPLRDGDVCPGQRH